MDNLMTLEEVANYLRVSDRTVKDWANAGELPGGKLGSSWRFRKDDIDNWLDQKLSPHKHSKNLSLDYTPHALLNPARLYMSACENKSEFLNFFIDQASELPNIGSRTEIADAVFKREALMSTGIGLGIAVPHVRLNRVQELNIFVSVNQKEIKDYDTLDGKPVRIGLFFVVGRNQHSEYIKALSVLLKILKNELLFKQMLNAKTTDEIYNIFTSIGEQA